MHAKNRDILSNTELILLVPKCWSSGVHIAIEIQVVFAHIPAAIPMRTWVN